jgi:hypothetical protein
LRSLPLPKSIAGFSELTREEWLELLPFFLFLIILLYLVLSPFLNVLTRGSKKTRPQINRKVQKDEAKVVSSFDIEDLAKDAKDGKVSYCRCWKSKKVRNRTNNILSLNIIFLCRSFSWSLLACLFLPFTNNLFLCERS